jgi:hypothetical protein
MFFLIRMAFWLGLILVLLPSAGDSPSPKRETEAVSALDAVWAAKSTVSDMRHFCERQPEACTVGSQTATALGQRAQAGAKMLYEFINEQLAPSETGGVTRSAANRRGVPLPLSRPSQPSPPQTQPSQNTLTPGDAAPAWRGPAARSDRPA